MDKSEIFLSKFQVAYLRASGNFQTYLFFNYINSDLSIIEYPGISSQGIACIEKYLITYLDQLEIKKK